MKSVFVSDIKKGSILQNEVFLVTQVDRLKDKMGRDYLKIIFADKTGKVEAKVWSDVLENINSKIIKPEKLLSISAKVDEYKGVIQLTVYSVAEVDESKLDDFIETSAYSATEMFDELMGIIDKISNQPLKALLKDMFSDEEIKRKYMYWPAGRSLHHEFRSGMLQHVLEMIEIAKSMQRFYPNINYDILYAGIILHDIGKLQELGSGINTTDYSKQGTLLGHITLGAILFNKYVQKHPDVDEDTVLHITHLILTHHGQLEFGSPVLPATLEATCLHYIDNLSSKAMLVKSALQSKNPETGFTDFNRWMGGVYLWDGGSSNLSKISEE